jgi:hypothetical protein
MTRRRPVASSLISSRTIARNVLLRAILNGIVVLEGMSIGPHEAKRTFKGQGETFERVTVPVSENSNR